MNRLSSRRLAATLLVAGLLLSACGQSDAAGRVRNSSLGEGCFATQAEKDKGVQFYQEFIALSTKSKNEFNEVDKAVKEVQFQLTDLNNKVSTALKELETNRTTENEEKVAAADAEWTAKQNEANELYAKLFEAQRNIREYPQFEAALKEIENKPVCEPTQNSVAAPVVTQDATNSIVNDTIPSGEVSTTNIEECQQPLEVTGGINQVIRVGESLEFIFPLCSSDSYVTLWGDFENGLSVYSNEIVTDNKPHVVFRLSSTQPLSGTYFFQQIDRISRTRSPKSQLDLTIVQPEEIQLCVGRAPNVEMSADGVLTAEFTCDDADYIEIQVTNIETGHTVVNILVPETSDNYRPGSMSHLYGTDTFEVTAYHVQWARMNKPIVNRIGDVLTFQFQLKPEKKGESLPYEPLGIISLPPFFDPEPNTETSSTSDKGNESTTVKILIAPTTSGVSCGDACTTAVIQQSGVASENVEKIEASVNGSEWVILTPDLTLPLLDITNTVAIRVTPKDGSKPVVLTNTLYRDAEAMSGANVAEVIALSVGGEQTITAAPGRSGISPAQTILLAVAVVILLALAMLFMRTRRKPGA
jgi:hypothetical protein